MPKDHASWDRKDLVRQRKHERPEQSFDSSFRWRNPSTASSPHHVSRWGSGDSRRPLGHGKHSGRHQFIEKTDYGHVSSRSTTRIFEDDNYRPSASRGDWRYNKNPRDDRVSCSQRDLKSHTLEVNDESPRDFGRLSYMQSADERPYSAPEPRTKSSDPANSTLVKPLKHVSDQNLADQRLQRLSHPQLDSVSLCERSCTDLADHSSLHPLNSHADRDGLWGELDRMQGIVKESSRGSIGWKHPIRNCSGSISSLGSGFSHSSSSKSLGTVDSSVQKTEILHQSASGDVNARLDSTSLPEEMKSRKKARLGWGEGLAKYEKKKVDVNGNEDLTQELANGAGEVYTLVAKSPMGSPSTPSSRACSSSSGMGDKASGVAVKAMHDVDSLCRSPSPVCTNHVEGSSFNLEEADKISTENFGLFLNEFLRTDDSDSVDPCSVQLSAMNKVLALKGDVLKALEVTESEIDKLESTLRVSNFESKGISPHCVAERMEEAVHNAISEVSIDASGERTQDTLEAASVKMDTSSSEMDARGCSNGCTTVNETSMEDVVCSMVLASNTKSSCEASEVFNMLLPTQLSCFDASRCFDIRDEKADDNIKQAISLRRRLVRLKENVLLLRFKTFQLSWKRDLHQLAVAKYHAKSQKKGEQNLYTKDASGKDNPAIITTELVNFTGKLLQDIQLKPCRDTLRMPEMILDEKDKLSSRFISSNRLVEDPYRVEKERSMINPWTSEEREIFLNKLAAYGKDFRKIASHLEHKTTADCIEFYYKNHKSDCFQIIKKKLVAYDKERKCTFMVAPRKRETGSGSLDILGVVSALAANASRAASSRQISSKRISLRDRSNSRSLLSSDNSIEGCYYGLDLSEKQTVAVDVLAGGDGSVLSERSSMDPGERCMKHLNFEPTIKTSLRCDDSRPSDNCSDDDDDDDTCSEESFEGTSPIHWTDEERSSFMLGFSIYGKNFAMISRHVGTRSPDQCRVFFSKVRKCLGLESTQQRSGNGSTTASVDNGSEVEDPCTMETSSVICSDDLCAKVDINSPTSRFNASNDGTDHSGSVKLKTDLDKDGVEPVETNASGNGDSIDAKTVESRSHFPSTATDEGTSASLAVLPQTNLVMESFRERPMKKSDNETNTTNRSRNCGGSIPECLHHVPIEVSMEDPLGVHSRRESRSKSPKSLAVQVIEGRSMDIRSSPDICFDLKKSSLRDVHVSNVEACQMPWSSLMLDPSAAKRSKSGEGFSLSRCRSLTSNGSNARQSRLGQKESRCSDSRRHSRSLSDTERSYNIGDSQLFGTLLSSHENKNKQKHHHHNHHPHERGRQWTTLNQHRLQNVPISSYGFWDGNRIRTGFTSLPESSKKILGVESSPSDLRAGDSREIQPDGLSVYTRRKLNSRHEDG